MDKDIQGKNWVVLVPCPFQGHITPMLELGIVLHSKGFSIRVMHTEFNAPKASNYPDFLFTPLYDNTNCESSIVDSTTMNLFALVLDLNVDCKAPFKEFLAKTMDQLKPRDRVACIVYDNLMCFCEDVANDLKLPSIMLRTTGAGSALAYLNVPRLHALGFLKETMVEKEPVPDLYPLRFKDLPLSKNGSLEDFFRLVDMANKKTSSPIIWNTFDLLEHPSLAKLQQHFQVPFFVLGPLHKMSKSITTSGFYEEDRSCISWLDKQAPNSVLYVSFGSIAMMDENSLVELAWGLANSEQPFLWVLRPGSTPGSQWIEMLPQNLKETIGERGLIVKWAPQKEVLAHEAVGGFMSHCGWNSTIESISEGVPMICYPCFGDQKVNARYLIHVWELGLELDQHLLERGEVEKAVRRLMVGEQGKKIRKTTFDFKEKAEVSLRKGGSSFNSLDDLLKILLSGYI